MSFSFSQDNGGSKILRYKLLRDDGDLSTGITIEDTTYDGVSSSHTVAGLTPGKKYRFQYVATNSYGDSNPSSVLTIAASELPDAPDAPSVDWT